MPAKDSRNTHWQGPRDIEIGVSDALQRHVTRHVVSPRPVSDKRLAFEHARPRILRECAAEATGVLLYVYVLEHRAMKDSFFNRD